MLPSFRLGKRMGSTVASSSFDHSTPVQTLKATKRNLVLGISLRLLVRQPEADPRLGECFLNRHYGAHARINQALFQLALLR